MGKQPVVAAAIVDSLVEPTLLLAAARAYPPRLAGKFELPGGKVEDTEDPLSALVREIREELGTELTLGPMVAPPDPSVTPTDSPATSTDPGRAPMAATETSGGEAAAPTNGTVSIADAWPILEGRIMWVWLAEVQEGAPPPQCLGSHSALEWVTLGDATSLDWLPTNLPIVEQVQYVAGQLPAQLGGRAQAGTVDAPSRKSQQTRAFGVGGDVSSR